MPKDFCKPTYIPIIEDIVDVLKTKVMSQNAHYFRLLTTYYVCATAAMMRTDIATKERGIIPVNMYGLGCLLSGQGKGHSTNIIEEQIIAGFNNRFKNEIMPTISAKHMQILAKARALRDGCKVEDWETALAKEFVKLGVAPMVFDSGTSPAVKQLRQKLLLARCGAINLMIDEIGSNFTANIEVLTTFLELYDKGLVKQKLTKNTADNTRCEDIDGVTPTNMLLFGTPVKLLDGGQTEDSLHDMVDTGFGRRLFFCYNPHEERRLDLTAEERYDAMTSDKLCASVKGLAKHFYELAAGDQFDKVLKTSKDNALHLIRYQMACEEEARGLNDGQERLKAELEHRYYKVLKVAGGYAFASKCNEISKGHINAAITFAEVSGEHFKSIMQKERAFVRLANYIANADMNLTQVDLLENVPSYKGSKQQRDDLLSQAVAYGYSNNIVIKRFTIDEVEFIRGEALIAMDLTKISFAYSQKITEGYVHQILDFKELHKMVTAKGYHYTAHSFINGYRSKEKTIPGFSLAVFDVDDGVTIKSAQALLKDYTYLIATTKSHTPTHNRFRIIMPMSHYLKLSVSDYSEFMQNLYNWLPFDCDSATKDICRKWESFSGQYFYNKGELLDVTKFIPKTKKAEKLCRAYGDSLNNTSLERWFLNNTEPGNRNNMLFRFGCMLLDSGGSLSSTEVAVSNFNDKLPKPIERVRLAQTVLKSLGTKYAKQI